MGCILGSDGKVDDKTTVPKWSNQVLCSGGDKEIFQGSMGTTRVAVCVAKGGGVGSRRIRNEINVLGQLGKHQNIINMFTQGITADGLPFLAIELVQPIGYDLDRLKRQYQFAGQSVPVPLMARIIRQLADALEHMHSKSLIHRDLKSENVLVDENYHAKLIDMGLCASFGTSDALRAPYMAPELCEGEAQRSEVDCWGVGVILHQVYQHQWQLLSCQGSKPTKMMPGIPSRKHDMDPKVQQAMMGLLKFKKQNRWTMDNLTNCEWLKTVPTQNSKDWHKPTGKTGDAGQVSLQLYHSSQPMPPVLAVTITSRNHPHLIGMPLGDLHLGKELGVTVLLIKQANGTFEKLPGAETKIMCGDWMYFGVPQGERFSDAVDGLEAKLRGGLPVQPSISGSESSGRFRSVLSKKEVIDSGILVEFSADFDCFKFPEHIGTQAEIGPNGLDMRKRFGINLVGIERPSGNQGEHAIEWFPSGTSIVEPGHLGLVMREPCVDGSSRPTLTDKDLSPLMQKELFAGGRC